MAEIVFDDVTKVFRDGTQAVSSFSLNVPDGALCAVLGPSGCGKTTLLRMVAGLEAVSSGRILIDGEDVSEQSPPERDIAMVFQNYALYPHMSVYDNIAFGLRSRRMKKDALDARVREVAALLGLDAVLKKRPRSLSGGQRQRVALGRAIAREPRAFLLDEPLSNVDARLRSDMREQISRLQRALRVTTLYVTHDQAEALMLGDIVAVMRAGTIQQLGPPKEIYQRPRNLFVAGFVGLPRMNLAEATVLDVDGALHLRFDGQQLRVDDATLAARPAIRSRVGAQVVIGIRPEDLVPAGASTPADQRLQLVLRHREEAGPDVFLHFAVRAPLLLDVDPRDAEPEEGLPSQLWAAERANVFLARVDRSAAVEGEVAQLAVRAGRLHLFDPRTGEAI